jgi:lipoate-protein ligase A
MNETSPMTECYFTSENEEITCAVCSKKLGIAKRRYKNMRFENGTYKHLLRYERYEPVTNEEVCTIKDYTNDYYCYTCKEHHELAFNTKVETKKLFKEVIEQLHEQFIPIKEETVINSETQAKEQVNDPVN